MGLPTGWVTNPEHSQLTNSQQITALGNGVLPLQAATAITSLRTFALSARAVSSIV
jgi:DNA (cytosine-5)-methyltransferase 1